jgi:hypothetical protein
MSLREIGPLSSTCSATDREAPVSGVQGAVAIRILVPFNLGESYSVA